MLLYWKYSKKEGPNGYFCYYLDEKKKIYFLVEVTFNFGSPLIVATF